MTLMRLVLVIFMILLVGLILRSRLFLRLLLVVLILIIEWVLLFIENLRLRNNLLYLLELMQVFLQSRVVMII